MSDEAPWIAWLVPHEEHADSVAIAALRDHGLIVRTCLPGSRETEGACLRVMQADLFRTREALWAEYASQDLPTLMVASSAEQEASLLDFLRPDDDVVRGLVPGHLLLLRLRRLVSELRAHHSPDTATVDPVTSCLSRREWSQQLVQHLRERPKQSGSAVVIVGLDHFKRINDEHGHVVGNEVLRRVGALLQGMLAASDNLGRLNGDEFALLLHRYDRTTALRDAEQLLQRIAATPVEIQLSGQGLIKTWMKQAMHKPKEAVSVSASAGLAFVEAGMDFNVLLGRVDQALRSAKSYARGRLVVFEPPPGSDEAEAGKSPRGEADIDPLTQVHNRSYFDARLKREFETAKRHGRPLCLALINLDRFHLINAQHGYACGDRVLRATADAARASVRLVDWVARHGGAEFCIVMPDTDLPSAQRVLERLQLQLAAAEVRSVDNQPIQLAASIGLAQLADSMTEPSMLFDAAQQMLQGGKRVGRPVI